MAVYVLMLLAVGLVGTVNGMTSSEEDRVAPNYMLDLYERNKYSPVKKGNERATTVRLITADFGRLKKDETKVFTFNLSTVMVSEKILSAELHIYKKEGDSPNPWKDIEVLMFQLNNKYTKYLGHDWLYRQQKGWQLLDVTSQVKRCLKNRKREHTLGIQLKDAVSKSDIKLNKYKRKNIRPFVVIYSNETQNLTFDHIDPRFSPRDLVTLEKQLKRNAGMQEKEVLHMTDFLQADEGPKPENNETKSGMDKTVKDSDKRDKRSIADNKVPQLGANEKVEAIIVPITGGMKFPKPNQFPFSSTNPSILRERKRLRNTKYGGEGRHRNVKRKTIPYPRGFHRKQRRMRRKRRRWNRRNRRRFDDSLWQEEAVEPAARVPNGVCQRRRLQVNFQDIGWNRWIINPKSFDAYYCDGVCPFQKIKSLSPSNHATIQSIVNAIGLNSKIPQPCCVPRTMSSVSLLFFDENDNVVLKNYPGMSVEKCACQ